MYESTDEQEWKVFQSNIFVIIVVILQNKSSVPRHPKWVLTKCDNYAMASGLFRLYLCICNRGDTFYSNFGLPILTWKPTQCLLANESYYCSPRVHWAAGCIQHSLSNIYPSLGSHRVTILSARSVLTLVSASSHPLNLASHLLELHCPQQILVLLVHKIRHTILPQS